MLFAPGLLLGQSGSEDRVASGVSRDGSPQVNQKRIFGIIPNNRTSPSLREYKPVTIKEKFSIASQDVFDRGTVVLGALFAGQGQLANSNRSFGQGVAGYARYFAASYADYAIGDYMTEAIFPAAFHQDPRYFRRGTGSAWTRLRYSVGQIVLTHSDSGHTQFNISELGGNAAAVAISNAYYADGRAASSNAWKFATQIGVDTASNILKEFSPDIARKFSRKHRSGRN